MPLAKFDKTFEFLVPGKEIYDGATYHDGPIPQGGTNWKNDGIERGCRMCHQTITRAPFRRLWARRPRSKYAQRGSFYICNECHVKRTGKSIWTWKSFQQS